MSPSRFRVRIIFRRPVLFVARFFIRAGVQPDTITYLSLFVAVLAWLLLMILRMPLVYGLLVFTVGFLDGVDGAVARGTGTASNKGAFTDSFVDKVSEAVILLAIGVAYSDEYFLGLSVPLWSAVCLAGWLLTSYAKSRADVLGVKDLDIGLGGRSERLLILSVFSVFGLLLWGLFAATLIGLLTAGYRYSYYKSEIHG
ncbi:MAG: hypothetical protein C4K49_11075 [Candidatus Thorarchaeota archaeon]|nr:MAG: hypothetical protein C4K49_11075 [Candidatus Thorarchaeota archaeon]